MSTIRETPIASRIHTATADMLRSCGLERALMVTIPMVPVAAQRPRAALRGGRVSVYMGPVHRDAERLMADVMAACWRAEGRRCAAEAARRWQALLDEPLAVVVHAVLPRLASAPKRATGEAEAHTAPEDVDNLAKLAMDAASGAIYRDDHRVVWAGSSKVRHPAGGAPRLVFEVWRESDHAEV